MRAPCHGKGKTPPNGVSLRPENTLGANAIMPIKKSFLSFSFFCGTAVLMCGAPALIAAGAAPVAKVRPQRIVSLNLCTDQYLLALADRAQIAGLTPHAANVEMSAAAAQARGLRILGQSAEEILEINPDLVVGMPARGSGVLTAIKSRQYRTLDMGSAESYADIQRQIRLVADAAGHPKRGEALLAAMNRDLALLPKAGKGRVAAYYQRRGYLTGTGTLVDDLMQRIGLVNLASRLGRPALSQLSIEEMVAARPDFIILESDTAQIRDKGTEMLHHPALRAIPRIYVPQAWTVCGGPAYVQAARSIVAQIGR